HTLRVNDKILQLKNQPMDDVYNGDIGVLKEIDYATKSVMVLFDRNFVSYPFDDLSPLTLAYALSVHKSQGSEYPYVFLIISRYHQRMLEKKLLYTAVTRAKSRLYILGSRQVFADALKRERPKRNTGLLDRLTNNTPDF
ncbi:MAG: ATP-binding domain-containing protein, partial [Erysipelotrichaceae bacterium]|nr:ATP-binding domain-containing protein [Erysipelotrichaceae bacterium]